MSLGMSGCIFSAKYTMSAEVYDETTNQDLSGQITRDWDYTTPSFNIVCDGRILTAAGSRVTFVEDWGPQYSNSRFVSITCGQKLNNRQRLGNIKTPNAYLLDQNTIFDVLGVYPVIDPFGNVIEYTVLAAEVSNPLAV